MAEVGKAGVGRGDSQDGGSRTNGKNYAKLCNISQWKKHKEAGANRYTL